MLLTQQKPTQTDRFGEVREGLPGSTLERGMRAKKCQELGRPCRFLFCSMLSIGVSQGIRLVSPQTGKPRHTVGRSLNDSFISSARQDR